MRTRLLVTLVALAATAAAGCYSAADAAREVNGRWHGRARVDLEARLGPPSAAQPQADGSTLLSWTRKGHSVERLPSGGVSLEVTPTSVDFHAEARPGVVRAYEYRIASARVDGAGRVLALDARFAVGGLPAGWNGRTGVIFGLHGGMGALDDAPSTLPSLGLYIGGMLGPRTALVGSYYFVNGQADGDNQGEYVHGHAWALAVQQWPLARLAVRGGLAMVLDTDPGGDANPEIAPGVALAASFALVRAGAFVLDLRVDAALSTASSFGMLGLGVNLN